MRCSEDAGTEPGLETFVAGRALGSSRAKFVKESARPSLGSLLTLRLRVEPISVLVMRFSLQLAALIITGSTGS
jgi:hypothetical protein